VGLGVWDVITRGSEKNRRGGEESRLRYLGVRGGLLRYRGSWGSVLESCLSAPGLG